MKLRIFCYSIFASFAYHNTSTLASYKNANYFINTTNRSETWIKTYEKYIQNIMIMYFYMLKNLLLLLFNWQIYFLNTCIYTCHFNIFLSLDNVFIITRLKNIIIVLLYLHILLYIFIIFENHTSVLTEVMVLMLFYKVSTWNCFFCFQF